MGCQGISVKFLVCCFCSPGATLSHSTIVITAVSACLFALVKNIIDTAAATAVAANKLPATVNAIADIAIVDASAAIASGAVAVLASAAVVIIATVVAVSSATFVHADATASGNATSTFAATACGGDDDDKDNDDDDGNVVITMVLCLMLLLL